MQNLLEFLEANTWLNLLFLVLAIFGILATIITYMWSRKIIKPSFNIDSFNLIKDDVTKLDDIEVLFKGETINNLTSTKIAYWNQGNAILENNHIANIEPIRIVLTNNSKLLDVKILFTSKVANNISFDYEILKGKEIKITFDYLGKSDGMVVQILHTGNDSDDITFTGVFKGGEKLKKRDSNSEYHYYINFADWIGENSGIRKLPVPFNIIGAIPLIVITIPISILLIIYETFERFGNSIQKEYLLKD